MPEFVEAGSYREATDNEIVEYFSKKFGGKKLLAFYFDNDVSFIGCGCCANRGSIGNCMVCNDPTFDDEDYNFICGECKKKGYYIDDKYSICNKYDPITDNIVSTEDSSSLI